MRTLLRAFNGGEVSPELFARGDDVRFQTGLALARNFVVLPHGPARNRPGTAHVAPTKFPDRVTRLLPFIFSTTQAYVIEFGAKDTAIDGYFRFFQNGVPITVTDGGVPAAYIVNKTFQSVNVSNSGGDLLFTFGAAHGFPNGTPVRITNDGGGAAPPTASAGGLTTSMVVYTNAPTTTTMKLSYVQGSVDFLDFAAPPGGQIYRVNRHYVQGDLVEGTPAGTPGYYYCLQDPTANGAPQQTPSNAAYWYPQPLSGVYEIPHPYFNVELFEVRYWQSNDVMTLVHPNYPVLTLRRLGVTNWHLVTEPNVPAIAAPTGVAVTANQGLSVFASDTMAGSPNPLRLKSAFPVPWINGETVWGFATWPDGGNLPYDYYKITNINATTGEFTITHLTGNPFIILTTGPLTPLTGVAGRFWAMPATSNTIEFYKVTAVDDEGNESLPSAEAGHGDTRLYAEGAYNTITWNAVTGAASYRVYKKDNGLFGLIGSTPAGTLTFKDDNIAADLSETPPTVDTEFNSSASTFPAAGCYHEQRKCFGRFQHIWATRPGTERDMTYSIPVNDDDRLSFQIAATEFSQISHMLSLGVLITLTSSTEYAITSPDAEVLTPSSVMAKPQSFIGAGRARPCIINNTVIYAAARGGHMRELSFQAEARGFVTGDISLRAAHLFDNKNILDLTYSKAPYPFVWAVSSDGRLLGATYIPDQEVLGWHQHTLGAASDGVESVAAIPEGNEDRLYMIVRRTINGSVVRHIERLAPFAAAPVADSFFVDDGKTFLAAPAGLLGGLTHLVGQTVAILSDGIVLPRQVVSGAGQITLPFAAAKVTVGLPIAAQLRTLPIFAQIDGLAQGQRKAVGQVWARVADSGPFYLGAALDDLVPSDSAAPAVRGQMIAEKLLTERFVVRAHGDWTEDGQVYIDHPLPLPLMVVGLTIEVATGD